MKDPKNSPNEDHGKKENIEKFIESLRNSAEKLNKSAEKMRNISKMQNANKDKIEEMNEKIVNALKRLEEVRKRLAQSRLNQLNEELRKKREANNNKPTPAPEEPKTLFISKNEIFLNKINKRSLKEFTDFTEFLKFNKMSPINDQDVASFSSDLFIKQLFFA